MHEMELAERLVALGSGGKPVLIVTPDAELSRWLLEAVAVELAGWRSTDTLLFSLGANASEVRGRMREHARGAECGRLHIDATEGLQCEELCRRSQRAGVLGVRAVALTDWTRAVLLRAEFLRRTCDAKDVRADGG